MRCEEVAEFVSALCDGERIPAAAAEHIGECTVCRARLTEYLEMGVELRRMASLEDDAAAPPMVWKQGPAGLAMWWQKGWERMRIPRVVFAVLVIGVVVLGSGLAMVGARASSEGTVVLLKISDPTGNSYNCAISTTDKKWNDCGYMGGVNIGKSNPGMLDDSVHFLGRDGDRIQLAVRSLYIPIEPGKPDIQMGSDSLNDQPEQWVFFTPGETVRVHVAGFGDLTITGEWMDHVPAAQGQLDPDADELRILSPIVLRGNQVLGDLEGCGTTGKRTAGVGLSLDNNGSLLFSLSPIPGGFQAKVNFNRITFQLNGQPYTVVAGAPISRSEQVWVLYDPAYSPGGCGSGELNRILQSRGKS